MLLRWRSASLSKTSPALSLNPCFMVSLNECFWMTGGVFGHVALLVATFNRVHAFPFPRRVVAVLRIVNLAVLVAAPLAAICALFLGPMARIIPRKPNLGTTQRPGHEV